MATAVVIPAYKPDESLLDLLRALRERAFIGRIVVVDDGSGPEYEPIFAQVSALCSLERHAQNRGKGAAIRTGLKTLSGYNVVTADCDGQHTPSDIEKIARAIDGALVMGVRRKREMPLRSKMGNTLTCLTFALVTHRWISDTQTGLRGIPQSYVGVCQDLEGDRYEYEMNMLLDACHRGLPIREVEIETVYIDNNRGSHFHTLRDGKRVYRLLLGWKKKMRARKKKL
ncbi:MAG TPA: glycosyltransferase family 2 protein [Candidatus Alectryocaccomicrobium excrementavium]|uniref:Glycosyltransferase family 2 protein n=1 Tax=Candidatus Alectryocaccomicrobium excrementavium TaxID=2840668 RepID=A0A9D1G219_9FIRM|nr:glycosyltransferase family 2 protein [Candidatus Alectryocaccomicrobium excrementavium]